MMMSTKIKELKSTIKTTMTILQKSKLITSYINGGRLTLKAVAISLRYKLLARIIDQNQGHFLNRIYKFQSFHEFGALLFAQIAGLGCFSRLQSHSLNFLDTFVLSLILFLS